MLWKEELLKLYIYIYIYYIYIYILYYIYIWAIKKCICGMKIKCSKGQTWLLCIITFTIDRVGSRGCLEKWSMKTRKETNSHVFATYLQNRTVCRYMVDIGSKKTCYKRLQSLIDVSTCSGSAREQRITLLYIHLFNLFPGLILYCKHWQTHIF